MSPDPAASRRRRLEHGMAARPGRAVRRAAGAGTVRAGALLKVVVRVVFRVGSGPETGIGVRAGVGFRSGAGGWGWI